MQHVNFRIVISLAFAASTLAGSIPRSEGKYSHSADAPSGFYFHTINAHGEPENHHLGDQDVLPRAEAISSITRRDLQGEIFCQNQYVIDELVRIHWNSTMNSKGI
jgi:hypothetical protein